MTAMRVAGAILAGGQSRRMGRDKALIEIDGEMMADRVARAMREAGVDPVVVYGGDPVARASLSSPVLPDRYPGEGPAGGVLGALTDVVARVDSNESDDDGPITHVLALACDLPFIDAATLRLLIDEAAGDEHSAVWVAATDRLQPACALWSVRATDDVRRSFDGGERTLHRVISGLAHVAMTVPDRSLENINAPNDLPG